MFQKLFDDEWIICSTEYPNWRNSLISDFVDYLQIFSIRKTEVSDLDAQAYRVPVEQRTGEGSKKRWPLPIVRSKGIHLTTWNNVESDTSHVAEPAYIILLSNSIW